MKRPEIHKNSKVKAMNKGKLDWIIDQYLLQKIDESTFCNEYHNLFVNEMDVNTFTDIEYVIFSNLSDISQRFTEYKEDFKLWKGFVTAEELTQKVVETKARLKEQK